MKIIFSFFLNFIRFYLLLGLFLINMPLYSQYANVPKNPTSESALPVRPNAERWDFVRYGNIPVNLYTGSLNLTIPLYQYKDNDFDISLSLGYHANGWYPNRLQGSLGSGWYLTGGGCITRQVRCAPDEIGETNRIKYLNYFHETTADQELIVNCKTGYGKLITYGLCLAALNNNNYDPQPDIFRFNFLGYSGNFMLGRNNTIHVYNTNFPAGEIKISLLHPTDEDYGEMQTITITMGDGYIYYFGEIQDATDEAAHEYTNAMDFYHQDQIVKSAWLLTRVTAPNGREIVYHYQRGGMQVDPYIAPHTDEYLVSDFKRSCSWDTDFPYVGTDGSMWQFERIWVSPIIPESITIDNKLQVNYYHTNRNLDYTLDSLSIKDVSTDRILKRCSFSYLFAESEPLRFLKEVVLSGEGTYRFDYYNENTPLPYHTLSIDHWGYFNGKQNSERTFIPELKESSNLEEIIVGKSRNPDDSYSVGGMLSKLSYPTGGTTEFYYEGNRYSHSVSRDLSSGYLPYLKRELIDLYVGGVRIKKIIDNSNNGETSREFFYKGLDNRSSGTLLKFPRYCVSYKSATPTHDDKLYIIRQHNSYSSQHNSVYSLDDTHIGYSRVVEKKDDGSFTEYLFSDYATCPDDTVGMYELVMTNIYDINPSIRNYVNNIYTRYNSRSRDRGKLHTKNVYDNTGRKLYRESYFYENGPLPYFEDVSLCGDVFKINRFYTADHQLKRLLKVTYSEGDSLINEVNYEYNSFGQLRSSGSIDSRGVAYREDRQYVVDLMPSSRGVAEDTMLSRNIIRNPLRIEKRLQENGGSEKLFFGEQTVYGFLQNQILPLSFKTIRPTVPFSTPSFLNTNYTETELSYDKYDRQGRLLQSCNRDGLKTVYIWGYGGLYLVALVENATFEEVNGIRYFGNLGNTPLSESLSLEQNSALRQLPAARVTTYTYLPFVGLSSVVDAAGVETHYEYDAEGRLLRITDHQGQLMDAYEYHVKQ